MKHIESAFKSNNQWYLYFAMAIALFLGAGFIGGIPLLLARIIGGHLTDGTIESDNPADLSAYGIDPIVGLVLMMLPLVTGLLFFVLLVKPFHGRTFKEVVNGSNKIRWSRFFFAAMVWAVFSGIILITDYILFPSDYEVRFDWITLGLLAVVSIAIIPLQTSFEELFFRGYLAQGVGVLFKNRILTIIIPAICFALLHGINPEVDAYGFWYAMAMYSTFGVMFGITSVLDDGIEVAMGAHAANNVFLSIFLTTKVSAIQTPALLLDKTTDPTIAELLSFIVVSIVFILILGWKYKWKARTLLIPIKPAKTVE